MYIQKTSIKMDEILQSLRKPGEIIPETVTAEKGHRYDNDAVIRTHGIALTCNEIAASAILIGRVDERNPNYFCGRHYFGNFLKMSFFDDRIYSCKDSSVGKRILDACMRGSFTN